MISFLLSSVHLIIYFHSLSLSHIQSVNEQKPERSVSYSLVELIKSIYQSIDNSYHSVYFYLQREKKSEEKN